VGRLIYFYNDHVCLCACVRAYVCILQEFISPLKISNPLILIVCWCSCCCYCCCRRLFFFSL